jgi:phenylacetate-CoA ligase
VIISTGEALLPEARAEITAAFGTPVINSFATTEGLMGTSPPGGDVLMSNSDMCIAELVDAGNRAGRAGGPVREGAGDQPLQPGPAAHPL